MKRFFVAVIVMMIIALQGVHADTPTGLCATSSVTSIDPSSVEVDEAFTVGISIESCGSETPDEVAFDIIRKSDAISVKEPLHLDIGSLEYSNSKRFITYHMRTEASATPGIYSIQTRLTYGKNGIMLTKDGNITITVTSDQAKLTLASAKTNPVFPTVGQPFTLTLRVENFGKGDANSVKADLMGLDTFTGSTKSFLGQLNANDDGILAFNLIPEKEGTFPYDLVVSFKDDFGTHEYRETLEMVVQPQQRSWAVIIAVIIIVGGVAWFFVHRHKKRKRESHMVEKLSRRGG